MTRWRLDLEYDGTRFLGWQVQPEGRTIQAVVERAVEQLFGEHARVCASGRTDTGVHAEQQVATFVSDVVRSERSVRDGLNAFLPPDVSIISARAVPDAFDPRRGTKVKCYRYTWLNRPSRSALRGWNTCHVRSPMDDRAMHAASQFFVGTHDFTSFRASGCQADHALRTLEGAEVTRDGELVVFRVYGTGFLRHMVRILAGTLAEVGSGRRTPDDVRACRDARDRSAAGKTAAAKGLTLEWVRYG